MSKVHTTLIEKEELKKLLNQTGLTKKQLSRHFNITPHAIHKWLNNERVPTHYYYKLKDMGKKDSLYNTHNIDEIKMEILKMADKIIKLMGEK